MKQQKLITPKLIRKELENIKELNDTQYYLSMIELMEEIVLKQVSILKKELNKSESHGKTLYVRKQLTECRELLKDLYEMRNAK